MRVVLCESYAYVAPKEIEREVSCPVWSRLVAEEKFLSPVFEEMELERVKLAFRRVRFDLQRDIHPSSPPFVFYSKYMNVLFCQIFSFCGVMLVERAGEDGCAVGC